VAHTQDDQAETFLLHLLRGAGRTGLGSMEAARDDLLRPLLQLSRAQVLSHLRSRGLEWREDPSNRDLSIPRNRVRHELIPYLESRFNPKIRPALARSAALLGDEADLLAVHARELLEGASRRDGEVVVFSRQALSDAPRAIARLALREALADLGGQQDISAVHVNRVLELAGSARPSGKRLALPGGREAVCCFGELRLGPRQRPRRPFDYALSVPGQVELPGGSAICATPAPGPEVASDTSAVIVAPEAPLSVRTRRPGDRVRTRGREVSLRSFLMARRVPADERRSLPLVASGRQVLWVPGLPVETAREGARRFVHLEFLEAACP